MAKRMPVPTRGYIRFYTDNNSLVAYVEWSNGSRTEGGLYSVHIQQLFNRLRREGKPISGERW